LGWGLRGNGVGQRLGERDDGEAGRVYREDDGAEKGRLVCRQRSQALGWREEGKNLMKGGRRPPFWVRENKRLSFLGFFIFCVASPLIAKFPPGFEFWIYIYR